MIERHFRRMAEIAALTTIFILPLKNYESTTMVIQALSGHKVDCSYGEAANESYPFDIIAVFGAGTYIDELGNIRLNSSQIRRLQASAVAYAEGYAPEIVLMDGMEDSVLESTRNYLQLAVNFFSKGKKVLPGESVTLLTGSINTASNAGDLSEYMDLKGMKKVLSITDAFHSQRAEILACNFGVNTQIKTVEEIMETDQYKIQKRPVIIMKENFEIVLLAFDPKGHIPTVAKTVVNFAKGSK